MFILIWSSVVVARVIVHALLVVGVHVQRLIQIIPRPLALLVLARLQARVDHVATTQAWHVLTLIDSAIIDRVEP